jgi:predicted nuclease of restriction endonuclease-like (RecB) superfamily
MIEDDKHIVEYRTWIKALKSKIQLTRIKVALSVNAQLIELYWDLGKDIAEKLKSSNWGSKVIEQISTDLKHEFPELKGFSRRNLYAVKQWYQFYAQQYSFVPQAVAQLPWGHNRLIVSRVKDVADAIFYCEATIKNDWSRDVLEMQLDTRLIEWSGNATHNFDNTLPEQQSKIASQTFKDPYNFDFLGLHDEALEREIENKLTANITEFLLELGKGFAFVGRQYKIEISETDYYLDLLFYHLDLRSYVVIELKAGKFKPEYVSFPKNRTV